jgi:alpha-L-arabinofuranosidase
MREPEKAYFRNGALLELEGYEPYGVKLWALGNEMYGEYRGGERYAIRVPWPKAPRQAQAARAKATPRARQAETATS